MQQRKASLPMRPDHGFLHSLEAGVKHYAGYSLIGRLKGLAELRGLELGILHGLKS
jgi:mannonate dehydratase